MSLYNLTTFKEIVSSEEYYRVGDTVKIKNLHGDDFIGFFNSWKPFYLEKIGQSPNSITFKLEFYFVNHNLNAYIRMNPGNINYKIVRSKNILIEKKSPIAY